MAVRRNLLPNCRKSLCLLQDSPKSTTRLSWKHCGAMSTALHVVSPRQPAHGDVSSLRLLHTTGSRFGLFDYSLVDYVLSVKTGDQLQAGTDANVHITLFGEDGQKTDPIKLDYLFRDDFERGQLDTFQLKKLKNLKDIHKIEIHRDNAGFGADWYVDYIEIEDNHSRKRFMFPIYRWIKADKPYIIHHMDNCLPQNDPEPKYREDELDRKRSEYECIMRIAGGPAQWPVIATEGQFFPRVSNVMSRATYIVTVKTGDKLFSGTDANIYVVLHSNDGDKTSPALLDCFLRNDFETGQKDKFKITTGIQLTSIDVLELWRDDFGALSNWYVDYVSVFDVRSEKDYSFPLFKWVKANFRYKVPHLDTSLPQYEPFPEQRRLEIGDKRGLYQLVSRKDGELPAQVKSMPADEAFSFDYKWDIVKTKAQLILTSKIVMLNSGNWESLAHLKNVYTKEIFCEPLGTKRWSNDLFFGHQRIASMNHSRIELCTAIPDKLGVTDEMLRPFLEGWTLQQVLDAKRLFMVDHKILEGLPVRDGFESCVPIALFFMNGNYQLVPIAIQLYQQKSETNPVFFPTDPPYVWMLAKMWFNNADANVHQSLTHLGFTHLLMEGVTVVTHRNLSQSHPIFKLLAPHFLYLIAINTRGLELLVSPNGWVDKTMNIGIKGMFALIGRGINQWRMNVDGTLPKDLERRGLLNHKVLPGYHFRDDALLLYSAINKYVIKYVDLYYDTDDKIEGDWEIQSWGEELVRAREDGGCGLLGVPGNGKFRKKEELYVALTSIIYTCSVAHAATNFPQYDEYAFPPNYPSLMAGTPPKTKEELPESAVLKALPDKPTTLDVMVVTKILSSRGTKSLGDFEVQYIFEPEARKIVDEFRADLAEAGKTIKERNKERNPPYTVLDPDIVPNSISI